MFFQIYLSCSINIIYSYYITSVWHTLKLQYNQEGKNCETHNRSSSNDLTEYSGELGSLWRTSTWLVVLTRLLRISLLSSDCAALSSAIQISSNQLSCREYIHTQTRLNSDERRTHCGCVMMCLCHKSSPLSSSSVLLPFPSVFAPN